MLETEVDWQAKSRTAELKLATIREELEFLRIRLITIAEALHNMQGLISSLSASCKEQVEP